MGYLYTEFSFNFFIKFEVSFLTLLLRTIFSILGIFWFALADLLVKKFASKQFVNSLIGDLEMWVAKLLSTLSLMYYNCSFDFCIYIILYLINSTNKIEINIFKIIILPLLKLSFHINHVLILWPWGFLYLIIFLI